MTKLTRQILSSLLLGLVAAGLVGCASTDADDDNRAERPWNRPQGWEGGIPGMNLPR
jgi:hypothetical protein